MKNKCLRCGHEWFQATDQRPKVCPRCKNYNWYKQKEELKEDDKTHGA